MSLIKLFFCLRVLRLPLSFLFFFTAPSTTEIYTLSLHDALPILLLPTFVLTSQSARHILTQQKSQWIAQFLLSKYMRSEEHTSELQSHHDLVCRLLLEKKKKKKK